MSREYTLKSVLTEDQLKRANEEFNVRGLKKIEVDTKGRWHLYHKTRHVKGLVHSWIYWQTNSLPDMVRQEYILTGKKRYFEWIGNSYVEKTDDAEWIKSHVNVASVDRSFLTEPTPVINITPQQKELKLPDRTDADPVED